MRIISPTISRFLLTHFRYVLGVFIFCLLILGYILVIGPEVKAVRQIGVGDLKSETKRLEDRKSYHLRLSEMLDRYKQINQTGLSELSTFLPPKPDIADLFIITEAIAEQSELSLTSISINPSAQVSDSATPAKNNASAASNQGKTPASPLDPSLKALDLSLTVQGEGGYDEFKDFLVNIEDNLRFFNIQTLTFTPQDESSTSVGERPPSQYSVNLKTYYLESGINK